MQAQIDAGQGRCVDCGRGIAPGVAWDVGHIVPVSGGGTDHVSNLGPSHRACNRKSGGRMGADKTNSAKRTTNMEDKRLTEW